MKERSAQPDAVQRMIRVSVGLPEMGEPVRRVRIQRVLIRGELVGVRIEPMAIGADVGDRHDLADARPGAITPSRNRLSAWQLRQCVAYSGAPQRRASGRSDTDTWAAAASRSSRGHASSPHDRP